MNIGLKNIIFHSVILVFISCDMQLQKRSGEKFAENKNGEIIFSSEQQKSYKGWWIYGEGLHIFKDEETLEEYNLEFTNEDIQELQDLYLAVCEMEHFPMECSMQGKLTKSVLSDQTTLVVNNFEILYIQGCE